MKVLDLQCDFQHIFEGWFGSENDFQDQQLRGLIACPFCGNTKITKKLSAPRLNFGASAHDDMECHEEPLSANAQQAQLQAAWMAVSQKIISLTDDVGSQFAEEARRIHYGEAKERGIRGQASQEETAELLDEGISVIAMPLPEAFKGQLQ